MQRFVIMAVITKIIVQKNRPQRMSVYLDGVPVLTLNVRVVARLGLRVGQELNYEQLRQIEQARRQQECFEKATRFLAMRMHSRVELARKLARGGEEKAIIEAVLTELERLGYVNDQQFAMTKALAAVQGRQHGRRRAMAELLKAGVKADVAGKALDEVYDPADALAAARDLVNKHVPRLSRFDPSVARRRLLGMLQRRGFEYDQVKKLVDDALGGNAEE